MMLACAQVLDSMPSRTPGAGVCCFVMCNQRKRLMQDGEGGPVIEDVGGDGPLDGSYGAACMYEC